MNVRKAAKTPQGPPPSNPSDPLPVSPYTSHSLHQPRAQSARSYLVEQGFDIEERQKRLDNEPVAVTAREHPTKQGFGGRLSKLFKRTSQKAEKKNKAPKAAEVQKRDAIVFGVGKRVRTVMTNLFSRGEAKSMRWTDFVKVGLPSYVHFKSKADPFFIRQ